MNENLKVVISGGGTGGHIFPAIAIADAIKNRVPSAEILFIGAKDRMEMDRVPKAGYPIEGLRISGFQRSFTLENLSFPFKLISSIRKATQILKDFKPDVVIGVGGFASGPTLRAANKIGIPTVIQEQNSYPGITNRIVGKKAKAICVAYEKMDQWFPREKTYLTGNPLRSNILVEGKRDEAALCFQVDANKPVVLLVGGSQGALGINKGISAQLQTLGKTDLQLIWQTGKYYYEKAVQEVKNFGLEDKIKPMLFIDRMDLAYAISDIVISRSGAMSISELAMVKRPVIFVPLPTAAEDHQTKNAQRLVDAEAALMVKNDETELILIPKLIELARDKAKQQKMKENIGRFARPNAAKDIVETILQILN
jgi:undecaprenyldiphospho-muramoylpentapeptide beta-N-acetylglucosaminyltransferase